MEVILSSDGSHIMPSHMHTVVGGSERTNVENESNTQMHEHDMRSLRIIGHDGHSRER